MFMGCGGWKVPLRSRFGVSGEEVLRFVEENDVVGSFLRRYRRAGRKGQRSTWEVYAETLCRYFKWLRLGRGWDVSPVELLNDQLGRRESGSLEERRFHVGLVLEFTRDNEDPYFKGLSDSRKYQAYIIVKGFYDYHEVPLTAAKGKYGGRRKRKNHPRQMTLSEAKRILGLMPQRERTILIIILQSGLELGGVVYKFGYMWPYIKRQLDAGKERIKIEIDERKGSGKWYFTYISRDAVQELKKWLVLRARIIEWAKSRLGAVDPEIEGGTPVFITNFATAYGQQNFFQNYLYTMRKHKIKRAPYEKVSHMLRKLFKTEASIPDRGVDRNIVEFFMGHVNGIELVGAEYDRTPEIYERVIEREYEKIEPYINIYSSSVAARRTDPLLQDIEQLSQIPGGREFFSSIVEEAKAKLAEMLKLQKIG